MRAVALRTGAHILLSVEVLRKAGAPLAMLAGLDIDEIDEAARLPVATLASLDAVRAAFSA